MVADDTSPERLFVLLSHPGVVAAAIYLRKLVDERKSPRGGWVDGNFRLAHTCSRCGASKRVSMIIHGKSPEHLASEHGVADKAREVGDLAKLMKLRPELKNPNVIRSMIAAQAAHEAIAEIPVRAVP